MESATPFHSGEIHVQAQAGERAEAERNGRIVAGEIPARAIPFLESQQLAVLASVDPQGDPWASLLLGPPGFARARGPAVLGIDIDRTSIAGDDLLRGGLGPGAPLGVLFVDLRSRQRLRINGRVQLTGDGRLSVEVAEAYPNCRKYVHRRNPEVAKPRTRSPGPPTRGGDRLRPDQRRWIEAADTIFVASVHPDRGADASHRGGAPGFVRCLDDRTLLVPDYPGNSMFNTLGNFAVYPRGGVLVPDFERGRTLQLTGRAEIVFREDGSDASGGTGRFWIFTVTRWLEREIRAPVAWTLVERADTPRTGQGEQKAMPSTGIRSRSG